MLKDKTCNVDFDIMLMKKYLNGEEVYKEKNKITPFNIVDTGYVSTNERLDLYYPTNLESKKVLSVTSSGDHILHAVLAGAKDVTGFDINHIAKYFSALKIAMVKTYDYDEFLLNIDFIYRTGLVFKNLYPTNLNIFVNILDKVSNFLTDNEYAFWQEYIKFFKDHQNAKNKLFFECDSNVLFRFNAWTIDYNYLKLRENLNDCNITYVDSNVNNLTKKLDDKFDLIYLSNILGRMYITGKSEIKLLKYLKKLLNKDGVIYDYNWFAHSFTNDEVLKLFYDVETKHLSDDMAFVYKYRKK